MFTVALMSSSGCTVSVILDASLPLGILMIVLMYGSIIRWLMIPSTEISPLLSGGSNT